MIHTSLSPNTEPDDLWLAFQSLVLPWNWMNWRKGNDMHLLEQAFEAKFSGHHAVSFQRGRDAFMVLLQSLGIGKGDEVILQAYTCLVVPNAILSVGAKPVYVDIEKNGFNIDPDGIELAITAKTKAVLVQHTFGEPANLDAIREICDRHKVMLIEDCAHALGEKYHGQAVGTFGNAAFFSFGRDKIISSVWGGMVLTRDVALAVRLREQRDDLPFPSRWQVFQALIHPLLFFLIKPFYGFRIGRGLIPVLQKMNLLPMVIFRDEKLAKKPLFMPQKMANVLARLALKQFQKLARFQDHRASLVKGYVEAVSGIPGVRLSSSNPGSNFAWLRFTIRTSKAAELLQAAKKRGIFLGDWYRSVLAPPCDSSLFDYQQGSCPRAEKAASESVNLPTHIQMTEKKFEKLIQFLQHYFQHTQQ